MTASGERLLSAESAAAMREPEVAIPEPWTSGSHVGLGWMLFDWGTSVYGHDGSTLGQHAYLRVVPGPVPVVVALLTNGGDHDQLYQDLFTELLAEHAGVAVPPPLRPPPGPSDRTADDIAGTYERPSMTLVVREHTDGPVLIARPSGVVAASLGTDEIRGPLVPFAPDAFLTRFPGHPGWLPVVFHRLDDGTRYVHVSGQATARKET